MAALWYSEMLSVLYENNFLENHSSKPSAQRSYWRSTNCHILVHSVQSILISNLVAYVLGHSDLQTVLIASAIRIAQCMGMDKQEDVSSSPEAYQSLTWEKRVQREVVRRVWWQLIIQDYFEIAFSNAYSK